MATLSRQPTTRLHGARWRRARIADLGWSFGLWWVLTMLVLQIGLVMPPGGGRHQAESPGRLLASHHHHADKLHVEVSGESSRHLLAEQHASPAVLATEVTFSWATPGRSSPAPWVPPKLPEPDLDDWLRPPRRAA